MKHFLLALVLLSLYSASVAHPSQPMESVAKYNVILVHGAADSSSGFIDRCRDSSSLVPVDYGSQGER